MFVCPSVRLHNCLSVCLFIDVCLGVCHRIFYTNGCMIDKKTCSFTGDHFPLSNNGICLPYFLFNKSKRMHNFLHVCSLREVWAALSSAGLFWLCFSQALQPPPPTRKIYRAEKKNKNVNVIIVNFLKFCIRHGHFLKMFLTLF